MTLDPHRTPNARDVPPERVAGTRPELAEARAGATEAFIAIMRRRDPSRAWTAVPNEEVALLHGLATILRARVRPDLPMEVS